MGSRKKAAKRSRPKLQFFDGEKRPPFGTTDQQLDQNERVATLLNRVAELEQTIASYSRGDELAFLSPQARMMIVVMSRTGLYGKSPRDVVSEIVCAALRGPELRDLVYSRQFEELQERGSKMSGIKLKRRR